MSGCFVLLGHPVSHSISPAIHGAAYAELGLDARYELRDVPDEASLGPVLEEIRRGVIAGANVTVPWKQAALARADRAEPSAADVGAANVLMRDDAGRVVAHNTDVGALAAELSRLSPAPSSVLVLGAGGASLAAVAAARRWGAPRVAVSARRFSEATPRAAWPNADALGRLGAELLAWPSAASSPFDACAASSGVIVQATSAGMHGALPGEGVSSVVPWSRLAPGTVAYDLVYTPRETPFLLAARAAGLRAEGGLGMLVGQAVLAFELWFGRPAPRAAMQLAAEAALARRSS